MEIEGQYTTFPYGLVPVKDQVRAGKCIPVSQERGKEALLAFYVNAPRRRCANITRIVRQGHTGSDSLRDTVLSFEQFDAVKFLPFDIVVARDRTDVKVAGRADQEIELHAVLLPGILAYIVVIVPHLVPDAPESTGKREEIHVVEQTIAVAGKQVVAPNADQVKTRSRYVAIERNVGRGQQAVRRIQAVEPGSYHSDAELGILRVVRTADNAEVEFLVRFFLVGIGKIVDEFPKESLFGRYGIAWNGQGIDLGSRNGKRILGRLSLQAKGRDEKGKREEK